MLRYDDKGWPCAEEGFAKTIVAHLDAAGTKKQLRGVEQFKKVQGRWKLTEISGGELKPVTASATPEETLEAAMDKVQAAEFTGKGDSEKVR